MDEKVDSMIIMAELYAICRLMKIKPEDLVKETKGELENMSYAKLISEVMQKELIKDVKKEKK